MRREDLHALRLFLEDYPTAKAHLVHLGTRRWNEGGVEVVPFAECLFDLGRLL